MYVSDVHASSPGMIMLLREIAEVRSGDDARSLEVVD